MSLTAKEAFAKLPQRLHNFFLKYPPRPFAQYSDKPSVTTDPHMNPFMANKNPESGKWHSAKVSLRTSSDLYKMARKFGIEEMLPPSPKRFYEKKYYDQKKWMRGVLSQKKQKWERELDDKLKAREEALANMDETIVKVRPDYKKQLKKKEEKRRTWF